MTIKLIERISRYRIKSPKLTTLEYLAFCDMVKGTYLDEKTCVGEEEGYLVFETPKDRKYLRSILAELFGVVKTPITEFTNLIPYVEIKSGDKFIIPESYTVYKKTDDIGHGKVKSIGHEGTGLWIKDDFLVFPVETENNFIHHKIKKN